MPATKEALQILLILLPGFVSVRVMNFFAVTKPLSVIGEVISAAVFCGINFAFYKVVEYSTSYIFSKDLLPLKDLLSVDHGFSWVYFGSMTVLFSISFSSGALVSCILNNDRVCKFLDRYKKKPKGNSFPNS